MNKVFAGALIAAAALTGCKTKSQEGGATGDGTFRLVVPAMATDVKQDELQTVQVTVERDAGFKQRVKLEAKASTGIHVEPGSLTVQPGDKGEVQLKIHAAKDAPLGEQRLIVKGTPEKGEPTEMELKVTVSAK